MPILTVANLETYLGATGVQLVDKYGSDQLTTYIGIVQEQTERFLGYVLENRTVTDEPTRLYTDQRGSVWFGCRYNPVKTFTSAVWIKSITGERQTLDTNFLYLEPSKAVGRISTSLAVYWRGLSYDLHLSYTAGQANGWSLPTTALYAMSLLVQELAEESDSASSITGKPAGGPLAGFKMGDYSETYQVSWSAAQPADLGLGTSLSLRAARLLSPLAAPAVQITGTPYR